MKPSADAVDRIVRMALLEDAPWGDLTSQSLIPADAQIAANLVAREAGVLCGADIFIAAMHLTGPTIVTRFLVADGAHFQPGAVLATLHGPARAVLQAERVALNFVQRLSGIATLTAKYVAAAGSANTRIGAADRIGAAARITDTRKTTPGLRLFERYAVRCGGGHNHRFSLSDAVMVKDNHLAVLMATGPKDITAAILQLRATLPHTTHIEVEVDRPEQIEAVLAANVDTILLDNFSTSDLRAAVQQVAGRALVEASGGITLQTVAAVAATGVDLISVGALTHSAPSLDLGLDFDAV